jgi:N-methylhydantoinase B
VPLPPKISTLVPADTVVTVELPGGGGYGSPAARDPERVRDDVRAGYVSLERAREDYGVAVDPVAWTVLADETRKLRAAMRGGGRVPR